MIIAWSWGKEPELTANKHRNSCFDDKNVLKTDGLI